MFIVQLEITVNMLNLIVSADGAILDGATAAERICPWRRSSLGEDGQPTSTTAIHDPAEERPTSSRTNDPHIHTAPLTASNFSGTYNKSSEYIGDFATTTKPEENPIRPNIRHLFDIPKRTPEERTDKTDSDQSTANL